jgi:hypothetical protein
VLALQDGGDPHRPAHGARRVTPMLPPGVAQDIRRDYEAKGEDGRYLYAVLEVARRNGVSYETMVRVARRFGLHRYQGNR